MLLDRSQKIAFLGFISGGPSFLQTFLLLYSLILSRLLSLARSPSELWWEKTLRTTLHVTVFFLLLVSGFWGRFPFPRKNLFKSPRVGQFKEFHCFPDIILCVSVEREWGKNEGRKKGWMVDLWVFKVVWSLKSWESLRSPRVLDYSFLQLCTSSQVFMALLMNVSWQEAHFT